MININIIFSIFLSSPLLLPSHHLSCTPRPSHPLPSSPLLSFLTLLSLLLSSPDPFSSLLLPYLAFSSTPLLSPPLSSPLYFPSSLIYTVLTLSFFNFWSSPHLVSLPPPPLPSIPLLYPFLSSPPLSLLLFFSYSSPLPLPPPPPPSPLLLFPPLPSLLHSSSSFRCYSSL